MQHYKKVLDVEQCLFRSKGYCISWKTLALDWQGLPARENEPFLGTVHLRGTWHNIVT